MYAAIAAYKSRGCRARIPQNATETSEGMLTPQLRGSPAPHPPDRHVASEGLQVVSVLCACMKDDDYKVELLSP